MLSFWRTRRYVYFVAGVLLAIIFFQTDSHVKDPTTLYQIAGGAAVGLIAFVITPVATLLAINGGIRFQILDQKFRPKIMEAMGWTFFASITLLAIVMLAAAIDTTNSACNSNTSCPITPQQQTFESIIIGVAAISILAIGRLFLFFFSALKVKNKDDLSQANKHNDSL